MGTHWTRLLSMPERITRAAAAALGGTVHETAQLLLPRFVRTSRLYEATAKNLLRISVELVGAVESAEAVGQFEPSAGKLAVRKTMGNAVELGSIFAFGFSPLWLLAAAADVTRGSRVYLDTLVAELRAAGVLATNTKIDTVDELLATLESASGTSARLIDVPPLELGALKRSLAEFRQDASDLPKQEELASVLEGLRTVAERERRTLLVVSVGVGTAFFNSAKHVGHQHLLDPYSEDLAPIRTEGFGAYAARVSAPYAEAVAKHFDAEPDTWTERGLARVRTPKRND